MTELSLHSIILQTYTQLLERIKTALISDPMVYGL